MNPLNTGIHPTLAVEQPPPPTGAGQPETASGGQPPPSTGRVLCGSGGAGALQARLLQQAGFARGQRNQPMRTQMAFAQGQANALGEMAPMAGNWAASLEHFQHQLADPANETPENLEQCRARLQQYHQAAADTTAALHQGQQGAMEHAPALASGCGEAAGHAQHFQKALAELDAALQAHHQTMLNPFSDDGEKAESRATLQKAAEQAKHAAANLSGALSQAHGEATGMAQQMAAPSKWEAAQQAIQEQAEANAISEMMDAWNFAFKILKKGREAAVQLIG